MASRTTAPKPVACLRCRRNRAFCTKEKPECLTCRKGHHECVYSDGRRISVLASYVGRLEARVAEYEARLAIQDGISVASGTSSDIINSRAPGLSRSIQPARLAMPQDDVSITSGMSNMVLSSRGIYLGSSSPTVPLGQLSIVGHLDVNHEMPVYNEHALRRDSIKLLQLPPYRVAKRYFQAQYQMIGTIFAFVEEAEFEAHLQEALLASPDIHDHEACLKYCQVLMIMAFGRMYVVNIYDNEDGPPGFAFFAQALQYLPEIHTEPSMLFCSVLCLIGYFMQNLIRRDAAFVYLGVAQRMALALGLHEEVDHPDAEKRRRIWWSIYSLDRIFCIKYGNPITMHDEDISVQLPSRQPHEPEYCAAVVLRHYTMLSQILSQIMERIYRKFSLGAVQDIIRALASWERDLPPQLRMLSTEIHSREAVSTYLHYYQCISMTARPLLFWVVQKRLEGDFEMSNTTMNLVQTCINAAKDTIAIMNAAADKDLVAVFGYMDGEHAFCAVLVMVVVNIAFPYDGGNAAAMESGMALLESLASKGNHHVDGRHQMLCQLLERARRQPQEAPGEQSLAAFPTLHPGLDVPELTDLDMINFKAAYSRTDMDLESELQHMSGNVWGAELDSIDDMYPPSSDPYAGVHSTIDDFREGPSAHG